MKLFSIIILSTCIDFINGLKSTENIYLFAYSWTQGFCYQNKNKYPGCLEPEDYWLNHFTIHGLWSQYPTTGYPQFCDDEPFDKLVPINIGMSEMTTYWPNVKSNSTNNENYDDFWQHEWDKHGTCSGLSQINYFNYTINLAKMFGTPSLLINYNFNDYGENNNDKTINSTQLRNTMGGPELAALQCYKDVLTGVYTCWTQIDGIPQYQIVCPEEVQKEDSCNKEYLRLY